MSAAPLQSDSGNVQALLAKVRELAVLPHVVYKVLEVSGSTDTSTSEIERAIVVDPGFSSRLLTVVNSAYYALPRKITSIREAVMFLGLKTIRQLAMTVGLYDMFVGKTDKESLRRRAWWRHSVDTAVCCRWIAKRYGRLSPEDAYTCGLLHYIGKTLLDRFGGRDFEEVERLMAAGKTDREAEIEVYGCDHMEVASAAAGKWGFPELLIGALPYTEVPNRDAPWVSHRACVAIGSLLAQWTLDGSGAPDQIEDREFPSWAAEALGLSAENLADMLDGAKTAISEAAAMKI